MNTNKSTIGGTMKNVYRHGEVSLIEVSQAPKGLFKRLKSFILAHSETGHNHVLEATKAADLEIYERKGEVFVKVNSPVNLVHKKAFDSHRTLEVSPGLYKRYEATEYDPFADLQRRVKD
jgi:hypothetical protein